MNTTQLFIAKKIKVGFNKRNDTYTGKLGYVIGFNGKKWRKEPSWESWREKYSDDPQLEIEKRKQFDQRMKNWENMRDGKSGYKYTPDQIAYYFKSWNLDNYDNFIPNLGKTSNDKSIIPVEYDNVPTSGFVLNRKAGGDRWGWNPRQTYCRVWDPRGFEFEITIPNLLFILQETTSTKGKGLEGEFVYSWDGKDLVLLPVGCEEYNKSTGFTELQSNKIGTKDLIDGASYKTKREEDLIYLGKLNWYEFGFAKLPGGGSSGTLKVSSEKVYIFYNEKTKTFSKKTSLASLAARNTDSAVSNYAEIMDEFQKTKMSSKPVEFVEKEAEFNPKTDGHGNAIHLPGRYFLKNRLGEYKQYQFYPKFRWEYPKVLGIPDYTKSSKSVFEGWQSYYSAGILFFQF